MRNGYHWREGMYFRRTENGEVEITQMQGGGSSEQVEWQRVISANEWASIVASVSGEGETADSYRAALVYHGRGTRPAHGSKPDGYFHRLR